MQSERAGGVLERCAGMLGLFRRARGDHSPQPDWYHAPLGPDRAAWLCVGCPRRGPCFASAGQIGRLWGPDRGLRAAQGRHRHSKGPHTPRCLSAPLPRGNSVGGQGGRIWKDRSSTSTDPEGSGPQEAIFWGRVAYGGLRGLARPCEGAGLPLVRVDCLGYLRVVNLASCTGPTGGPGWAYMHPAVGAGSWADCPECRLDLGRVWSW